MTKRAAGRFARSPRDFYVTPASAVAPLLAYLPAGTRFVEPCAGDGALIRALEAAGHVCALCGDIEPGAAGIARRDWRETMAMARARQSEGDVLVTITNPPWSRDALHDLIDGARRIAPLWLLFDADWMHTRQAAPHLRWCHMIVSVGRVSWMGNGVSGFDNACWYQFQSMRAPTSGPAFHFRDAAEAAE